VPLYNQNNQQVLQTADQTLNQYREQVRQGQANQQDASSTNWFQMMQRADSDFQARRQELAKAFGPNSQQVMAFDAAAGQIKSEMQALAGSAGPAPTSSPNDLSQLQLPNDQNTLQLVRNLQLLMACPAQVANLSAAERTEVDTAAAEMQKQLQQLQGSNPQLANQLIGFFSKFQQDWATAKASTPPGTGTAQQPGQGPTSAGRKYRDIPLELPGDAPASTPRTTVPANLGGE
jgi:hypothetical protein